MKDWKEFEYEVRTNWKTLVIDDLKTSITCVWNKVYFILWFRKWLKAVNRAKYDDSEMNLLDVTLLSMRKQKTSKYIFANNCVIN